MKIKEGDRALLPELPSTVGKLSAERYLGRWLALYFYQKDYSEPSLVELRILNSRLEEIRELNGDVVGISPDDLQTHMTFTVEKRIKFELVSDQKGELALMYGALKSNNPVKFRRMIALISPEGLLFKTYRSKKGAIHIFELVSNLKTLYNLSKNDPVNAKIIYHL